MSRRQRVISIAVAALASLAIAIFLVYRFDTKGQVRGTLALGGVCGVFMIAAVGLLIFRRTRWAGEVILCCALSIAPLFNAGVRLSRSHGWVVWAADSPPVNPLLKTRKPATRRHVESNEVVYYKPGVTKAQMKSFEQAMFYQGSHLNPGITYFRRLEQAQAHGHYGFAIGVGGLPNREQLRTSLAESPLVLGILHDQALDDVPVP